MDQEQMLVKAAIAMVPLLEQESNMFWGERTCSNLLRWTLHNSGFRLTPVAGDGAEADDSAGASDTSPAPEHDG